MTLKIVRTTVYDVDADIDIEAVRVEHIETEDILAYVPAEAEYYDQTVAALSTLSHDLVKGD